MSQISASTSKSTEKRVKATDAKSYGTRIEASKKSEQREEFLLKNSTGTNGRVKSSASVSKVKIFRDESDGSAKGSNLQIKRGNLNNVKLAEKENLIETNGSKQLNDEKALEIPSSCSSKRLPLTSKVIEPKPDDADDIISGLTISELLKLYENQFKILRGLQKNKAKLEAFLKKIQLAKDEKLKNLLENTKDESEIKNIREIQVKFEKLDELKEKYLDRKLREPFENIVNKMSTMSLTAL